MTTPNPTILKQSKPLTPAAPIEGHRYVTLPTIPPISILVPNDTKVVDKLDKIISSNPTSIPTAQPTIKMPAVTTTALSEINSGLPRPMKTIPTSAPNQFLLDGLRQQKSQPSAFIPHSLSQPQFHPVTTLSVSQHMTQNVNNNNVVGEPNSIPLSQWMHLISQPQHQQSQKHLLLQQQPQPAPPQQHHLPAVQTQQPNFHTPPFPPSITNQPQLRFQNQPPPPSSNAGLSALLGQSNPPTSFNGMNANFYAHAQPPLNTNASMGMQFLNQSQQSKLYMKDK